MLKQLRHKKTRKRLLIILAIIIIPAFTFWGASSAIRSSQENIAGKIFGRAVTLLEYKDAFEGVKNLAIMQFGDNYPEMQKRLNIEAQAWERLLLLYEAQHRGIRATDKEVETTILNYPFFRDKSGAFSERSYNEILRYVFRTKARDFEEQVRKNVMLSKLFDQVTKEITVTDKDVELEYRKGNEEISLTYAAGLTADFTASIVPSADDIKAYYAANSLQFRLPLSFNMDYIAIAGEGKNEKSMQEYLKNIISRLKKKESFEAIAKEMGNSVKETGFFAETDPIPGIGWSPQVSIMIFKAKQGEYLPPIFADNKYYLFKLKERKEPSIPELATIPDKVKEAYQKEKALEIAKSKTDSCQAKLKQDFMANPKSVDIDKAAKEFGLKSGQTLPFKFGSYIEGIGASDTFWLYAQTLKDNEPSSVITTQNGFYIIAVKSRTPFEAKKYAETKQEFSTKVLVQKQQEYFARFLYELKEKAQRY
ncbi:MAG TPA: SurA N-terminal domain-containing protein [Candidatus Omnitrophota bacterium]|nr:SurA N-terminal domain-containing protein [Candidatus Omnitrophota bacterium]HPT07221.1 SurA N-terminal domain-containing protein [Candidatus Omnitrophota bacterium]